MTAAVRCHYSTLLCVSLSLSLKSSKSESACSVTSFSQPTGRCVCFETSTFALGLLACCIIYGPPPPGGEHKHTGGSDGWLWGQLALLGRDTPQCRKLSHSTITVADGNSATCVCNLEAVAVLSLLSQSIVFVSHGANNNYPLGCCWASDLSYEDT